MFPSSLHSLKAYEEVPYQVKNHMIQNFLVTQNGKKEKTILSVYIVNNNVLIFFDFFRHISTLGVCLEY